MPATNEELIAIWSKAVDTQMHFNEMSVKSRQLGLAFVTAALALGVALMSQGDAFSLTIAICGLHLQIHVAALLVMAAMLGIQAVKILDLTVYHRMLRGAVSFGEDFERNYMSNIFSLEKGMTEAISHFSRFDDASTTLSAGRLLYNGANRRTAEEKIRRFYRNTTIFLLVAAVLILLLTNLSIA